MNYNKEIHTFESSYNKQKITYYVYTPNTPPKAILQISHGMCEYIERYEPFIDYLTGQGYLVCGNDHLGHKNSAATKDDLGFFAPKNGWIYLPKDLAKLTRIMKQNYPDLPIFLFGHSMGSFVARTYISKYGDLIDGAIICGTGGPNPALKIGQLTIRIVKALKGERHRSKLINKLMFGSYNKKCTPLRTSKDWLSRDPKIVDEYLKDEYCMFLFTTSAFLDLTYLLEYSNSKACYERIPKSLPIFQVSGDMDPLGEYGKGIEVVRKQFEAHHFDDYQYKFYPGMRHEILNETGRDEVYEDLKNWLDAHIK